MRKFADGNHFPFSFWIKQKNNDQYKPCIVCKQLFNVGDMIAEHHIRNRYGGVRKDYYHWKCFNNELLNLQAKITEVFGVEYNLLDNRPPNMFGWYDKDAHG